MYYVYIFLTVVFIFLLLNHFVNQIKNGTFEGLENDVSKNKITSLFLSTNKLKSSISEYKTKNEELNSKLDTLEKKINCKTKKNSAYSDATKSKHQELKNKQNNSQNFSLQGV